MKVKHVRNIFQRKTTSQLFGHVCDSGIGKVWNKLPMNFNNGDDLAQARISAGRQMAFFDGSQYLDADMLSNL